MTQRETMVHGNRAVLLAPCGSRVMATLYVNARGMTEFLDIARRADITGSTFTGSAKAARKWASEMLAPEVAPTPFVYTSIDGDIWAPR